MLASRLKTLSEPSATMDPAQNPTSTAAQYFSAPEADTRDRPWQAWYGDVRKESEESGKRDTLTVNAETRKSKGDHVAA